MAVLPITGNTLFNGHLDHLDDVAPRERDALAQQGDRPVLGSHLLGEVLDLAGARDEWRQVEAEGVLYRPALPSPGEALAVGGVATDDQPCVDERGEMPAQRRRRHAMGANGEFPVGREHHDPRSLGSGCAIFATASWIARRQRQRRLLVKAQERVQDRERSIGDADQAPSLRSAPETVAIYGQPVRMHLASPRNLSRSPGSPPWRATTIAAQRASLNVSA